MIKSVKKTIVRYDLLRKSDSVLIALSGGPDSVALIEILSRLASGMKLNLYAVYVNHQIRPRAAKKEERFCQSLCVDLSIPLEIVSEDIPFRARQEKKGLEETARDFRSITFKRLADEFGCNRIALGHHADDQVETILFRILRGTGRSGLRGMLPKRGRIVRPLFHLTRQDILQYLKERSLTYCTDRSNSDTRYSRNYIRHKLLPAVRERLNPAVNKALLSLAETTSGEEAFLDEIVCQAYRESTRKTPGGKIELDLILFDRYDLWVRCRLIRYCVTEISGSTYGPDKAVVDRLIQLVDNKGKATSLPGRIRAVVTPGKLVFARGKCPAFEEELRPGVACRIERPRYDFGCRLKKSWTGKFRKRRRANIVMLDWEKLKGPMKVRNLRQGDRFGPLGMSGTKKVSDYLTDRKLDPVYRDEVVVVCDTKGIVWLTEFEIAERVKIDSATRKVLTIECNQG